ncbi:MAG: tetratricopeptide repeat protein [Elusimicrobia bacterium]|nr:tetratricopeptide repeat protein [Elusimicrobiota bacterium]
MRRLLRAAALIAVSAGPALGAFEDLGAGARAPGMGGAFAPVADDVYTIYYNPAGLGLLERPQLGTAYAVLYPGLQDASSLGTSFIGYAQPLAEGRNGTLATAWNAFTLNSLYREDSLYLGYGRRWFELGEGGELYAGANLKYLRSAFGSFPEAGSAVPAGGLVGGGQRDPVLSGSRSQSAFDSDAGLLYRLGKNYSAGLDVMHVNSPNVAFAGGASDRLPPAVKLGLDYRSLISNLVAEYDAQRSPSGEPDQTFTAAAERWLPKLFLGDFGLRGGLSVGTRSFKQLSAGLSYRNRRMSVDYAITFPVGGVAAAVSSHRVALTFRFGRATEDEESLEMVLEAMKQVKAGERVVLPGRDDRASGASRLAFDEALGQARALEARARYGEAQGRFALALTLAPADRTLVDRYGRLSFVAGQIRELPDYQSDPAQASLHLGILNYLSGDYVAAVQKVSQALRIAPERKDIERFLSLLEAATGVSRSLFSGAKAPDHQAAVSLTQAGAALEDGRYDEAVSLSREVLRVEPDNAAAWENLGTAYFALQDFDSSAQAWDRAYELEESPAVRVAIKDTLRRISRMRTRRPGVRAKAPPLPARPVLTPREIRDLFNQAVDHYARREFAAAKNLLEKILEADPDNVEARKALRRIVKEGEP